MITAYYDYSEILFKYNNINLTVRSEQSLLALI